jgi:hypothetical protein
MAFRKEILKINKSQLMTQLHLKVPKLIVKLKLIPNQVNLKELAAKNILSKQKRCVLLLYQ